MPPTYRLNRARAVTTAQFRAFESTSESAKNETIAAIIDFEIFSGFGVLMISYLILSQKFGF